MLFKVIVLAFLLTIPLHAQVPDNSLGLVAMYHMNELKGSRVYDSSPYRNDATFDNAPVWVLGVEGYCLQMNGSNTSITAVTQTWISFATNNRLTFSLWVFPYTVATTQGLFHKSVGFATFEYECELKTDSTIAFTALDNGGSFVVYCNTTLKAVKNRWNHIIVAMDSSSKDKFMMVNGVLEPSPGGGGGGSPQNGGGSLSIGKCWHGNNMSGLIDEFAVFNRFLTDGEAKNIYYEGLGVHRIIGLLNLWNRLYQYL